MSYRRRASPIHAARAGCACAYCAALLAAALLFSAPLALGSVTAAIVGAGVLGGVGRELRRAALFALPLALSVAAINALLTRDGLTVIMRLGDLPVLGHTDVTLEATAYGGVLGLRAVALILCAVLYTSAVDPDQVLRLFRRVSFHSALTATLANRMVPVLLRDARRLGEAQRCRPGGAPSRFQLMRVATANMLERSLDVAAALEVRGYAGARRPRAARIPYSRHDLAFAGSALAILSIAIASRLTGAAPFRAYPSLYMPFSLPEALTCAALIFAALLPFLDRRGIER